MFSLVVRWWKNVSIAKKLYFVVGLMAVLIAGELLTLRFAMRQLSAARAFVGAESLWSKAQKNAVFSLQRFGTTRNEKDFIAFREHLKIPDGDHQARLALQRPIPDLRTAREGFLKGHVHPDDIDPIIELLRKFSWISYLSHAIHTWEQGDALLAQLEEAGQAYHLAMDSGDQAAAEDILNQVKDLNQALTKLEEDFSSVLGEGSRWLEMLVLSILTVAVLTVESIGLTLAFFTSRAISRGLNDLNWAAQRIGQGDFASHVEVKSRDEIGRLGDAVNAMGEMLKNSYAELETRVALRTAELVRLAAENAKLYEEAKANVQTRDEFLSIASHELKTPLTSLYLQMQRLTRMMPHLPDQVESKKFADMFEGSLKLTKRITVLLDELLDLTRLRIGKFQLHREECDLIPIVSEVIAQVSADAARAGSPISLKSNGAVKGEFDSGRLGQVFTNLLSNAIKYGEGKPIEVQVRIHEGRPQILFRDGGIGISPSQQSRIFERFERAEADPGISGLGLGLYIAQQIVKAHGGLITVESVPEHGSTFTVQL
jgi:signal transduction histidine kinase